MILCLISKRGHRTTRRLVHAIERRRNFMSATCHERKSTFAAHAPPTKRKWPRSFRHDARLQSRPIRDYRRVDIQVLRDHFRRRMFEPLRQGKFFKCGGAEDSKELQIRIADVLHIVSVVARSVTYIARVELHRDHVRTGIEHAHARLALDVVLPLVGIGMPMHLA
jgi:hypothetical protein